MEDWTQDLLIHLRYLPATSKHREAGKEDIVQTFDPHKHHGANQARFFNYINLCLANKFRTMHSKRMKNATVPPRKLVAGRGKWTPKNVWRSRMTFTAMLTLNTYVGLPTFLRSGHGMEALSGSSLISCQARRPERSSCLDRVDPSHWLARRCRRVPWDHGRTVFPPADSYPAVGQVLRGRGEGPHPRSGGSPARERGKTVATLVAA